MYIDESEKDIILELEGESGEYKFGPTRGDSIQFEIHNKLLKEMFRDHDKKSFAKIVAAACTKVVSDFYSSGNNDNSETVRKSSEITMAVRNNFLDHKNCEQFNESMTEEIKNNENQIIDMVVQLAS
jgi:hypothetical protein